MARAYGFILGFLVPASLLILGALDFRASGRSIVLLDDWVSKDAASSILFWDWFRFGDAGVALGRGISSAIVTVFGIGPNDARGWPLHLGSGIVCILAGLLGAWLAGALFSTWSSERAGGVETGGATGDLHRRQKP